MPWAASTRPSLGLGLLVAAARRNGFSCTAEYLNLDFAATFGPEGYELIASHDELFALGEHVFAVDLFGRSALRSEAFLDRFYSTESGEAAAGLVTPDDILAARDVLVPDALDRYVTRILAHRPQVVGMTCVFNQVLPSLALARRLKAANPGLTVLLGGACVHGKMGETYAKWFPELVDHVFTGEADLSFPALLESLARGEVPAGLPGVTSGGTLPARAPLVQELDALPIPCYDDFFAARAALGTRLPERFDLVFESSRGCWWGQRSHCTFCGLNNEGMTYRMKSPDRVIRELVTLSETHQCLDFEAADNILPQAAYRTMLPALAGLGTDFRFLYEIKANITRDDAGALARAGVRWVQPGVESFSDHVLRLMRKGSTGAQNIQLLKWLQEAGVTRVLQSSGRVSRGDRRRLRGDDRGPAGLVSPHPAGAEPGLHRLGAPLRAVFQRAGAVGHRRSAASLVLPSSDSVAPRAGRRFRLLLRSKDSPGRRDSPAS